MGCSGQKAVTVVTVEHSEFAAPGKATTTKHYEFAAQVRAANMEKYVDCCSSQEKSGKYIDSVASPTSTQSNSSGTSGPSATYSMASRRDELLHAAVLFHYEQHGGRTDKHNEFAAQVRAATMKKHVDGCSSQAKSEKGTDSVASPESTQYNSSRTSGASTTCLIAGRRDELLHAAVLLHYEQHGRRADKVNNKPCVAPTEKIAKLRINNDSSHRSKDRRVAVNSTGRRGKVLA